MENEKRLIDANAIPWEEHYVPDGDTQWEYKKELCVCKSAIDKMPTVDAVEVVHGRWIKDGDVVVCSNCGEEHAWDEYRATYCEDCGAKMDSERRTDIGQA